MMGDFDDYHFDEYSTMKENRERKQHSWFIGIIILAILIQTLVSIFSLVEMKEIVQGIPHDEPMCAITPIGEIFLKPTIVLFSTIAVIFLTIFLFRKKWILFFAFVGVGMILLLTNVVSFLIISPEYPYETITYCLNYPFTKIILLIWVESCTTGISVIFFLIFLIISYFRKRSVEYLIE